jgi:hypothetical protein
MEPMTETTAPKKKRKPSGAAVAGAFPRPKKYPRQMVVMADDALADRIEADARRHGMSKSEVARLYLEAGIEAADRLAAERARLGLDDVDESTDAAADVAGG